MASKNTLKADVSYMFVNRRTGLVLEAPEKRGQSVTQAQPDGSKHQLWNAEHCANNTYRLTNADTSMYLDTVYSGTVSGTWASVWDEQGDSQLWNVEMSGRGYRKLVNVKANKVLDIAFMSNEPGVPAQIWEDVGGENQQWKIVEFPSAEATALIAGAGLKEAAKKAASSSSKIIDGAEEVLSDVAGLAAEAANNVKPAVKKAKRAAKKTVRNAASRANAAKKEIKKNVQKTAKAAKPIVEEAKDKVKDAAEELIVSLKKDNK